MKLPAVLDGASKAAAGVGVILAMSYMSGLFKMVAFYGAFHADWLFDMLDVQAFISEGLPLTSLLLVLFATYFFGLERISDGHKRLFLSGFVVISSLAVILVTVLFIPSVNLYAMTGVLVGSAGAAFAAWVAHGHVYPSRSALHLYNISFGLILVLCISPYLIGKARAGDVQNAREVTTEIVDSKNRVIGVLVRVVSGKYLALDCDVEGQLRFHEISSSLKLRRSSGQCKSTFE
ncbi:hypothetical protein [Pseudomonas siliginis]|uniref:hypothetical protein n=1 Tax=Pseudomonas siliginis TaxID=2842346 RepID=UPI002092ADB0|nr:hypothetical protein [Pseudomonas siliginis]USU02954.1 hypothetical protein NF680_12025 [Pseudomonas siliginis]